MDDNLFYLIVLGIISLFVLGIIFIFGMIECKAKANVLGYKCEYGIITGCILEKPNGKKVLLEQLREYGE